MWRETLAAGDPVRAWDQLIARYRPLILAVVRRTIRDDDQVIEVFADICADLCADDLALPARHTDSGKSSFSTWLVTVVHHRAIDWVRHRDGRRRIQAPAGLSVLQQQIFDRVVGEGRSHVEAYELIRQREQANLSFATFMREVSATFQNVEQLTGKSVVRFRPGAPEPMERAVPSPDEDLVVSESAAAVAKAMEVLAHDERLAIQLFVVDELSAASVARTLGWPNAKAVYNRVYRALEVVRRELEKHGVSRDD